MLDEVKGGPVLAAGPLCLWWNSRSIASGWKAMVAFVDFTTVYFNIKGKKCRRATTD